MYVVILEEHQNNEQAPVAMFEGQEFLLVLWDKEEIKVHQSDPENMQRLEMGVRVLATAMKNSPSQLTAFIGTIAERAMEQGVEQFINNLPQEQKPS